MKRPPLGRPLFNAFYCLLTPSLIAPGSLAVPVLLTPAAVSAPEVLASPRGEGLLVPVVPLVMVPPVLAAPSEAPGPTLPELDEPPVGCCAKAEGEASAKMQTEANMIFFIE